VNFKRFRMPFKCPSCGYYQPHVETRRAGLKTLYWCERCSSAFRLKVALLHGVAMGVAVGVLMWLVFSAMFLVGGLAAVDSMAWLICAFVVVVLTSWAFTSLVVPRYAKRFFRYERVADNPF